MICIRKQELLSTELEQLKTSSGVSVTDSHTVGGLSNPTMKRKKRKAVGGVLWTSRE